MFDAVIVFPSPATALVKASVRGSCSSSVNVSEVSSQVYASSTAPTDVSSVVRDLRRATLCRRARAGQPAVRRRGAPNPSRRSRWRSSGYAESTPSTGSSTARATSARLCIARSLPSRSQASPNPASSPTQHPTASNKPRRGQTGVVGAVGRSMIDTPGFAALSAMRASCSRVSTSE